MAAARILIGKVAGGAFPAGSVVWRLVAANNCALGRAARASGDLASGLREVQALIAHLGDVSVRVHDDPRGWRWSLEHDGEVVAVAARPAPSRRDAQTSALTFIELLPAALATPPPRVPAQARIDLTPDRVAFA